MSHYRLHGIDGLRPKRSVYCAQFKLEGPCQQDRDQLLSRQVAAIYDTRNSNQVMAWRHIFDTGGMAAPESRKQKVGASQYETDTMSPSAAENKHYRFGARFVRGERTVKRAGDVVKKIACIGIEPGEKITCADKARMILG